MEGEGVGGQDNLYHGSREPGWTATTRVAATLLCVAAVYGKPIESLRRDAVSVYIGCHVASTMKSRPCVI